MLEIKSFQFYANLDCFKSNFISLWTYKCIDSFISNQNPHYLVVLFKVFLQQYAILTILLLVRKMKTIMLSCVLQHIKFISRS